MLGSRIMAGSADSAGAAEAAGEEGMDAQTACPQLEHGSSLAVSAEPHLGQEFGMARFSILAGKTKPNKCRGEGQLRLVAVARQSKMTRIEANASSRIARIVFQSKASKAPLPVLDYDNATRLLSAELFQNPESVKLARIHGPTLHGLAAGASADAANGRAAGRQETVFALLQRGHLEPVSAGSDFHKFKR